MKTAESCSTQGMLIFVVLHKVTQPLEPFGVTSMNVVSLDLPDQAMARH